MSSKSEPLWATTTDGIRLAIHHRPARGRRRRHPVVLLHGLGSNRFQPDLPERSLTDYLAAQGHDCYVPELRGSGDSDRPSRPWDLDDLVRLDLPAVSRRIQEEAALPMHWLGISLGGVLLFCHAIVGGGGDIQSGVTLGSCLDYSAGASDYQALFKLRGVLRHLPGIPVGHMQRFLAPIAGTALGRGLDKFHVNPDNIEPAVLRAVYRSGFHTLPMSLLLSLARTFEPEGLATRDGAIHFLERAGSITAPFQLWAGAADRQCSVRAVEATALALGSQEREVIVAGLPTLQADYGHMDLYLGPFAPHEIWPRIADFLVRHDGADQLRQAA